MTDSLDESPAFSAMVEKATVAVEEFAKLVAPEHRFVLLAAGASLADALLRAAFSATTSRSCGTCGGPDIPQESRADYCRPRFGTSICPHCLDGRVLEWAAPQVLVELGQMVQMSTHCNVLVEQGAQVVEVPVYRVVPPRDVGET